MIQRISYKDHITYEEVFAQIQQAIGSHEDLLTIVKRRRNHFARHSERGKKTRQTGKRSGEDNIREWTGLEFGKSQRAVENREKRRKLVVKSSVVTQRPPTVKG